MPLIKRINLKRYIPLSAALLTLGFTTCRNTREMMATGVVFVAVILNQWMLLNSIDAITQRALSKESDKQSNVLINFLFKAIILIVAISFGVHIMGNRIIIPILIYVIQIFVLYFSIRENKKD
jgi:magnesium-transporting ATPase (P-type)